MAGDEEGRIRCLAFEQEERRVRDRTDTFMSGGGSLSDDLRRLTDERTRCASESTVPSDLIFKTCTGGTPLRTCNLFLHGGWEIKPKIS